MQSSEASQEDAVAFSRVFDAPRALVWRLWADPGHRLRWWGPEGMALAELEMDFREGGAWRIVMARADGHRHPVHGVFREVREPSRLSFTYVNDDDGHETLVAMDFVDLGTRTEMRFHQARFRTAEGAAAHNWGWNSTFDLLAAYAPTVSPVRPTPVGVPRIEILRGA